MSKQWKTIPLFLLVFALLVGGCSIMPTGKAATYSDPFAYCAATGSVDVPDSRYTGEKLPDSIIGDMVAQGIVSADAPPEFQKNAVWRCMDAQVWVCSYGANIPCDSKADLSKTPSPEMNDFCASNPDGTFLSAYVTGHSTVFEWQCTAGKAATTRQVLQVDSRGYPSNFWYRLTGTGGSQGGGTLILAYASILFGALFLVILVLLHFLKRELDPSWRMISEYEIGRFGWLMRMAFFCWGLSVLTLVIALWPQLTSLSGFIGRWWMVAIGIALFGAGIFKTNPILDNLDPKKAANPVNVLHTICGAIVIFTFPIAATLVARRLLFHTAWLPGQGEMTIATVLVWVGLAAYFASLIISRIINPASPRVGPKIYQGWPNRIMVVIYIVWIFIVAGNALRFIS